MTVRANTKRSEEARTAHVLPVVSHARADEWDDLRPCGGVNANVCVGEGCHGEACLTAALEDARFHEAVSAELVACTLGQRSRLELRTDTAGKVLHAASRMRANLAWLTDRLGR